LFELIDGRFRRSHPSNIPPTYDRKAFFAKGGGWGLSPPAFCW
jgi:hypothetical protein